MSRKLVPDSEKRKMVSIRLTSLEKKQIKSFSTKKPQSLTDGLIVLLNIGLKAKENKCYK